MRYYFSRCEDRNGGSWPSSTGGTTDSVNVVLDVPRRVVRDDAIDNSQVHTAGYSIGTHHSVD